MAEFSKIQEDVVISEVEDEGKRENKDDETYPNSNPAVNAHPTLNFTLPGMNTFIHRVIFEKKEPNYQVTSIRTFSR